MKLVFTLGIIVIIVFGINVIVNAYFHNIEAVLGWSMATLYSSVFYLTNMD